VLRMRMLLASLLLVAACGGDPPNVGGTCTAADGCDEGLTCETSAADGYCTQTCTTSGETEGCPEESICDSIINGQMACVKICKVGTDCRPDQDCNGVSGSNIKACKPKS
jgi:hypothetical protein